MRNCAAKQGPQLRVVGLRPAWLWSLSPSLAVHSWLMSLGRCQGEPEPGGGWWNPIPHTGPSSPLVSVPCSRALEHCHRAAATLSTVHHAGKLVRVARASPAPGPPPLRPLYGRHKSFLANQHDLLSSSFPTHRHGGGGRGEDSLWSGRSPLAAHVTGSHHLATPQQPHRTRWAVLSALSLGRLSTEPGPFLAPPATGSCTPSAPSSPEKERGQQGHGQGPCPLCTSCETTGVGMGFQWSNRTPRPPSYTGLEDSPARPGLPEALDGVPGERVCSPDAHLAVHHARRVEVGQQVVHLVVPLPVLHHVPVVGRHEGLQHVGHQPVQAALL